MSARRKINYRMTVNPLLAPKSPALFRLKSGNNNLSVLRQMSRMPRVETLDTKLNLMNSLNGSTPACLAAFDYNNGYKRFRGTI